MTDPKSNNIGRDTRHSVVIWWVRHDFIQRGLLPAVGGFLAKARNTSQNIGDLEWILWCVIPVVWRETNGEVNISHENTTMVVWIYDGI